ncbi:thrombospondin type 3 repeat-containing protein, partial [Klebsiella pneumoniae]|nr:thrombospondin type 3 repeat-containing protein [Klebsiella pneumoniae]
STIVVTSADAPGRLATTRAGSGRLVLAPDPSPRDSDEDGLSDGEEAASGTDPAAADTDRDGIADRAEAVVVDGFAPVAMGASPLH